MNDISKERRPTSGGIALLVAGAGLVVLLGGVGAGVLLLRGGRSNEQPTGKEGPRPEPGAEAKDFTNALGMKFVRVPRGTFWMGDRPSQSIERHDAFPTPPQKQVEIPRDFYIGVFLVTQEQWQNVMGSNPSWFSRGGPGADKMKDLSRGGPKAFTVEQWFAQGAGGGADMVKDVSDADLKQFPVENVTWDEAQEFVKRVNAREKEGAFRYRLPTEAEWEYACRGAATSQAECAFDFYCGQPSNDLSSEQANFDGSRPAGNARAGKELGRTTKVGSYQPNRLGIYDMHGQVFEWCADDHWPKERTVLAARLVGLPGVGLGQGPLLVASEVSRQNPAVLFTTGLPVRGGWWHCGAFPCRAGGQYGWMRPERGPLGVRLAAVPSGE